MITRLLFSAALLFTFQSAVSQLEVQNDSTVTYYITQVFQGPGVEVSNVTFNGMPGDQVYGQVGSFSSNGSYVPIENGICMSTGDVAGVDFDGNPVILGEQTSINVNGGGLSGDLDLETISGFDVNDIAIIEFDVIPSFEFLMYDYSFGSEEYPEFVNSSFNDAFGFFLSGPNIAGPYGSGAINIAMVPVTEVPVSIDNVNNGNFNCSSAPSGPCVNCEYYIDNCAISDSAFDGMTVTLLASAQLIPGETYHIKLAIGDAGDTGFDSGIFLQEYSFRSANTLPTSVNEVQQVESAYARNPMGDQLILSDLPEEMRSYRILDMQGREVVGNQTIQSGQNSYDVSRLRTGLYVLIFTAENGQQFSQPVVKE